MAEHTHYQSLYRVGCHHLADGLRAQGNEILYLSGPMNVFNLRYFITRDPSIHDLRHALANWRAKGVITKNGILSYAPMTLVPIWRRWPFTTKIVAQYSLKITKPNLRNYIQNKGYALPDILMVSQPSFATLLTSFGSKAKVYRITDDLDKFPGIPASVKYLEREGVRAADAVVVTAKPLVSKVEAYGAKNIIYLPNGVDVEHYRIKATVPSEYKALSGPIAIYMGAIDSWFDINTLRYCAAKMPDVTFVIIGAARIKLNSVLDMKNVVHLGRREYAELPGFLQHATVGIIPFLRSPLIEAVSPLKLYEYMACGLPVVSTRWSELEQISSPALLVKDREEFKDALRRAIDERGTRREVYHQFAEMNSWRSRSMKLQSLFENLLARRKHS